MIILICRSLATASPGNWLRPRQFYGDNFVSTRRPPSWAATCGVPDALPIVFFFPFTTGEVLWNVSSLSEHTRKEVKAIRQVLFLSSTFLFTPLPGQEILNWIPAQIVSFSRQDSRVLWAPAANAVANTAHCSALIWHFRCLRDLWRAYVLLDDSVAF